MVLNLRASHGLLLVCKQWTSVCIFSLVVRLSYFRENEKKKKSSRVRIVMAMAQSLNHHLGRLGTIPKCWLLYFSVCSQLINLAANDPSGTWIIAILVGDPSGVPGSWLHNDQVTADGSIWKERQAGYRRVYHSFSLIFSLSHYSLSLFKANKSNFLKCSIQRKQHIQYQFCVTLLIWKENLQHNL